MMYHFIFGLVLSGGGACPVSAVPPLMFSSAMLPTSFPVSLPHAVQHPINSVSDRLIDNEEVNTEKNHGNDHHRGCRLDFFPVRKCNFPHLIPDIRQKAFHARRELRDLVALIFLSHCYRLSHLIPSLKLHWAIS